MGDTVCCRPTPGQGPDTGQCALQPWTEAAPTREQIPAIATRYVPWPERGIADEPLSTENADSAGGAQPATGWETPARALAVLCLSFPIYEMGSIIVIVTLLCGEL